MVAIYTKLPKDNNNYTKNNLIVKAFFLLAVISSLIYCVLYLIAHFIVFSNEQDINERFKKKMFLAICDNVVTKDEIKLQNLINKLLNSANKTINISSCISNKIHNKNAFASLGNVIIVSPSLFQGAKDIDELAFIVAHEIGHILHQDPLTEYSKNISTLITSRLFSLSGASEIQSFIVAHNSFNRNFYSRKQELKADTFAMEAILKTYNNVYPPLKYFENILKEVELIDNDVSILDNYYKNTNNQNRKSSNILSVILNTSADHPAYKKRMENILKLLQK